MLSDLLPVSPVLSEEVRAGSDPSLPCPFAVAGSNELPEPDAPGGSDQKTPEQNWFGFFNVYPPFVQSLLGSSGA